MTPEQEAMATRAAAILDGYVEGGFRLLIFPNDWGNWVVKLEKLRDGQVYGMARTAETQHQAMIYLAFALDTPGMLA